MRQTGYTGITSFTKDLIYDAGWCEFYYTPIENIDQWPSVLPLTQELSGEPILKAGASWFGPILVANQQLGYKEDQQRTAAGIFYKIQVDGFYPGDGRASRVNISNMPFHRYALVGKQRAGGMFVLLGAPDSGYDFNHNFQTGRGNPAAITEFIFSGDALSKPMILPSFGSQTSTPMPGYTPPVGGGGGGTYTPTPEIISFTAQPSISIAWNSARKLLFGSMPVIEVWFLQGLYYQLANIPITVDAPPPDTSVFNIDFGGITDGFIVIK